ncbi:NosD domain-containing protein [Luteimonas aquatica]|uniref:NosD domain-containing protein n=1 Tax=Luteimonas aquatica TaxID=450364 RepID=UPI001F5A1BFE|nr:NosD domain-containing protein [Luteimonas aquatica]
MAGLAFAGPAKAAQSFDSCAGFIDSLPATITTPGTWCLRKDLSTAARQGGAITVNADRVILDCNDFKLEGTAGLVTNASGILSSNNARRGIIVRNCQVQGFRYGIALLGSHHIVEDSRIEDAYYVGIATNGSTNTVRGNTVRRIGGNPYVIGPSSRRAIGISMFGPHAFASNNTVAEVDAGLNGGMGGDYSTGIMMSGVVENNRVLDIAFIAAGLHIMGAGSVVRGNHVSGGSAESGSGIFCDSERNLLRNNDVDGYEYTFFRCTQPAP